MEAGIVEYDRNFHQNSVTLYQKMVNPPPAFAKTLNIIDNQLSTSEEENEIIFTFSE